MIKKKTFRENVTVNLLRSLHLFLLMACCTGCHPKSSMLETAINYEAQERDIRKLPSLFFPLSDAEKNTAWGDELKIGVSLAKELDLYRAITAFKRAKILLPLGHPRQMQLDFYIMEAYYLGLLYHEAIETFTTSGLPQVSGQFPAFRELLLILYDCYLQLKQNDKAQKILEVIENGDPNTSLNLRLSTAIREGKLSEIEALACKREDHCDFELFLSLYQTKTLSSQSAQTLNALLPGAGYWYVGQRKTAFTSLMLNSLFIAMICHFIEEKNWGAVIFTGSLEFGWYFGGINGAGLAAKEYNTCLYKASAEPLLIQKRLFPSLMFSCVF